MSGDVAGEGLALPRFATTYAAGVRNGYEHHVAVNRSRYGQAVTEALSNYKRWNVYTHGANGA